MPNKFKKIALLLGDISILYFSLYLTLVIRYGINLDTNPWQTHIWPFTWIFTLWILVFYISNLYNLNLAINNKVFTEITWRSLGIAILLSIAFFYLTPQTGIAPKTNLLIFSAVFSVIFFFWRRLYNWSLKSYLPKNYIAIIGYSDLADELMREIELKKHLGFRVSFLIDEKLDKEWISNIPIIKSIAQLEKLVKEKNISTLVLTADLHQSAALRAILFQCLHLKISYIALPDFYESVTGKVPIDAINQAWFLENLNEGDKIWFDAIKQAYDFALALLILFITIPFWFIIAVIIKIESHGPIFFIMTRVGRGNKEFKLIKFRTMRQEGNSFAPTSTNDPRVTKFGNFLRQTRLDEIPQVINILRGEMSFVGPRPERPEIATKLAREIPFYDERMLVKPGLTGSDQISGEYHSPSYEDSLKKLQYDLFYIKNRSFYLDLSIILKTVATVLSRKGM
jgi:exopolysaccharide biosynthesis polyprenyl glycosylphosphotransferase